MQPEDRERLLHMLDACPAVRRFMTGRRREDLESDEMLLFAVVRALEVIGEVAARVSNATRAELPEIPWPRIAAMRNRLIHAYFAVDTEIVWRTATEDLPALVDRLDGVRE